MYVWLYLYYKSKHTTRCEHLFESVTHGPAAEANT